MQLIVRYIAIDVLFVGHLMKYNYYIRENGVGKSFMPLVEDCFFVNGFDEENGWWIKVGG